MSRDMDRFRALPKGELSNSQKLRHDVELLKHTDSAHSQTVFMLQDLVEFQLWGLRDLRKDVVLQTLTVVQFALVVMDAVLFSVLTIGSRVKQFYPFLVVYPLLALLACLWLDEDDDQDGVASQDYRQLLWVDVALSAGSFVVSLAVLRATRGCWGRSAARATAGRRRLEQRQQRQRQREPEQLTMWRCRPWWPDARSPAFRGFQALMPITWWTSSPEEDDDEEDERPLDAY